MKENANLIFVGLPHTGKSTYIGALWYVTESKELDDTLHISEYPDDREYLNKLREAWIKCDDIITRNVGEFRNDISLKVKTKAGTFANLVFPDLAGEIYKRHFSSRKMSGDFAKKLGDASSVFLFINPIKVKQPVRITTADQVSRTKPESPHKSSEEGDEESSEVSTTGTDAKSAMKPWEHEKAPTQVILVDLLQMILDRVTQPKISIIVSLWDKILNLPVGDPNKVSPREWLNLQLPLLGQFLDSNQDLFKIKVFGISSQGGDYKINKQELIEMDKPSRRIIVENENSEKSSDISLPIKWILDVEN